MALERVFTGSFDGERITDPPAVAHVARVLRLKPGNALAGYDGENEWELEITGIAKDGIDVAVRAKREIATPYCRDIILAPALVKGARWEMILEKSVELGVSCIRPVSAARSVVKLKEENVPEKIFRWKKVMGAAVAQCAGKIPELEAPAPLAEVLKESGGAPNRFLMYAGPDSKPAADVFGAMAPGNVVLLVGPEGDWTETEITAARDAGFTQVSLGERILRAETAAIAAVAAAGVFSKVQT